MISNSNDIAQYQVTIVGNANMELYLVHSFLENEFGMQLLNNNQTAVQWIYV